MVKDRAQKLSGLLDEHSLDGILITHRPNLRYLCGFSGTDGALLVGRGETVFLTDSRYTEQARTEVTADRRVEYSAKLEGIVRQAKESGMGKVGFEADTLPFATVEKLREEGGKELEWHPLSKPLHKLRCHKDACEIEILEQAADLAATAFEEILPLIRPGAVERDVALALEFAMKRRGAEEKSFDFIVASGERGALPHGVASDKPIRAGELVTIDFGARWRGYHSDETITLAVGPVGGELRDIYGIVLEAHDRAMHQVRPGIPLKELDRIAREFIASQGYGQYFGHGLGHGVGLEVHESPTVSTRSEDVAEAGMVITIEPGIYIPGRGGVRIEDTVLITENGFRKITRLAKDFLTVPG
ncbi:MAG: Xaa-Pro peptidase family protein [Syntrophotaleaceae bacterium]